jgi:hypothetical protein
MLALASCCVLCLAIAQPAEEERPSCRDQPLGAGLSQDAAPVKTAPVLAVASNPRPQIASVSSAQKALVDSAGVTAELDLAMPTAPSRKVTRTDYSGGIFLAQALSIPWRLAGATATITLTGVANWDWGSSPFHFHDEGWFGKHTKSLGMDKLGHGFSAFVLTDFFSDGLERPGTDRRHAHYTAGLLAMGMMTYIEVFDGFSKEHGFSREDLAVDAAGVVFSILRRSVPGLREKVDFRLLYTPDKATFASLGCFPRPSCHRPGKITARSPVTDYSNQRYLLAFKLAGFKALDRTPLRFLELQAGYYARGFTAEAEARREPLRRRIFLGAGANIGELLFAERRGWFAKAARSALEYLQVPKTAVYSH